MSRREDDSRRAPGFEGFFEAHWADLLRAGLGSIQRHGPALLSGEDAILGDLLASVAGALAARADAKLLSGETLVAVVDTAIASGALGARMTGGGFGGSAIVLVESADADTVTKAIQEAFAAADFTAPRVFVAVPSAGARRVS